ncbi:MAG: hypothetical protein CMD83_12675 [Gammaproteobacteria bacterium]|nr:hypothetical protein [Gammaproteobacteria bacterium]
MKLLATVLLSVALGFVLAFALFNISREPVTGAFAPPLPPPTLAEPVGWTAEGNSQSRAEPRAEVRSFDAIFAYDTIFEQLYHAHVLAASLDFEQLQDLTRRTHGDDDAYVRQNIGGIFVERMVQLNAPTTLAFVRDLGGGEAWYVGHVFTSWARNDPPEALGAFEKLPEGALKNQLRGRLMADTRLRDSGLLSGLADDLNPQQRAQVAQAQANSLPPAEAFELALTLPPARRSQVLYAALSRWYVDDLDGLLARVAAVQDERQRRQLQQWAVMRVGQHDFDRAIDYASTLEGSNRLVESLIRTLAQTDPATAMARIAQTSATVRRQNLSAIVLGMWVGQDPDAALAYVDTSTLSAAELTSVGRAYAGVRPERATDWAMSLPDEYSNARRAALTTAVSRSHAIADRLLEQLDESPLRNELLLHAVNAKAEYDPDMALEWIKQYEREQNYPDMKQGVLLSIARRDPTRAAEIISTDLGSASQQSIVGVAQAWAATDVDAAEAWVRRLPETAPRDPAFASIVYMLAGSDFDQALDMAAEIGDTGIRSSVARHLANADPSRIGTIADRLGLSETFADEVRKARSTGFGAGAVRVR